LSALPAKNGRTVVLKIKDVQDILGVKSPNTVKAWIAAGRFPGAVFMEGEWKIPAAEVHEFREAGERAAALSRLPGPVATEGYDGDSTVDFA
jgi:hypothetical protein